MINLKKTKDFFARLRRSSPCNLMIPIIVSLISGLIILKNKAR